MGARLTRVQKIEAAILVALFWIGMCLPLLDNLAGIDPAPELKENRFPVPAPTITHTWADVKKFPKAFEAYFRDHLGFRDALIRGSACIQVRWLHTSPNPAVVVGKDGWLFFGGRTVDYYRATLPEEPDKIPRIARLLDERRRWLADRGIRYVCVFVPNKSTIYPEYLPEALNRVHPATLLDRLLVYTAGHTEVETLDLRPTLLENKGRGPLYKRTGTHWYDFGAYFGYRSIIERLAAKDPGMRPIPESDLRIAREQVPGFDLAYMIATDGLFPEEERLISVTGAKARRVDNVSLEGRKGRPNFAMETGNPDLPRAVAFRDSFTGSMIAVLSEHFDRIAYIDSLEFNADVVLKEKPDIVFLIAIERALIDDWPANPLVVSHDFLEDRFQKSEKSRFRSSSPEDRRAIVPVGGATAQTAPDKVLVRFPEKDSRLSFTIGGSDSASQMIMRMDLAVPEATTLRLHYTYREKSPWTGETFLVDRLTRLIRGKPPKPQFTVKERTSEFAIPAGHRVHYVPIDATELAGPVDIGFGMTNTPIEFHDIEIRSVSYPAEDDLPRYAEPRTK